LRTTGAALNLWTNAWRALHALGIADDLRATHFRLKGSQMVSLEDEVNKQVSYRGPGKRDHEVRCVKRGVLLETLAAGLPAGTIRYNSKVVDIFTDSSNSDFPTIMLEDGTYIKAKVLIGCDGVNSIVSEWLGFHPAKFMGRSTSRGLSTYPEGHDFDPKLYINLQQGIRAGYIPINHTEVFWFLNRKSLPQDSETAQEPKLIIQEALDLLRDFPEEYHDILKRTLQDTPTLSPLRCRCPWTVLVGRLSKGTVAIAGDAMHAMTPYIGQGGCSTLEDAVVLGRCLAEGMNGKIFNSTNEERKRIEEALKKYVEVRRWRVFMLMTKSYITGLLQPGSGRFAKFLREKIMTKVSGNALSHAEYDCGGLFDTMK
jgi:2-polyprenyl-6-methoxyphenol hydroxylase-like FAD-dependent oxidoreductase